MFVILLTLPLKLEVILSLEVCLSFQLSTSSCRSLSLLLSNLPVFRLILVLKICHWNLAFLSGDIGVLTFYSAHSASVQAYFLLVCYHYFLSHLLFECACIRVGFTSILQDFFICASVQTY